MKHPVRVTAIATTIGVLGGAVAAAAIPTHQQSTGTTTKSAGPGPAAATGPAPAGPTASHITATVHRTAPARPQPTTPGAVLLRVHGTPTIQARAADTAGGPEWAVRVFDADRTYRSGEHGRLRTIGRNRCVQLGRIYRGRFGWLDGDGTFRPVRPSLFSSPASCGSKRPDLGGNPYAEVVRTTGGLSSSEPGLASTVLWGRLGTGARDAHVRFDGRTSTGTAGSDHVVLRVTSANTDVADAAVSAAYDGRARSSALASNPTRARLAVRAADPAGGLPYGLSAAQIDGRWCTGRVGRVLDGRVGTLDYRFGTFQEATGASFSCDGRAKDEPPVLSQTSGGADLGSDPIYTEGTPTAGRVARRTPEGLTWVAGQVRPDVKTITFRTPHDIRTLLPSGPARAYLVVYDGQFPAGRSTLDLALTNGKTTHAPLFLGVY